MQIHFYSDLFMAITIIKLPNVRGAEQVPLTNNSNWT